jgi:hypothetical protein
MNLEPVNLTKQDVISLEETKVNNLSQTFKVDELLTHVQAKVQWAKDEDKYSAFSDGIDCQVLRPNSQGWQRGKFRIVIEFCPELPTAPAHEVTESSVSTSGQEAEQPNGFR